MRLPMIFAILLPGMGLAEPVTIAGPAGPLEAELVAVENATHAIVIIPGSGPTDRDGNSPHQGMWSDSYKLLAEALAAEGVTSIRIDKRGFYGSSTAIVDPNNVTIAAYAADARDWVDLAARHAPCVWIAGHSEGGLVALVAAQDAPDNLCGLILMATPGRPVGQLLLEQLATNPANVPYMDEITDIVADLEAGQSREQPAMSPVLRPFFSAGLQRYMIDLFAYDPVDVAGGWSGPVLIMQGGADMQVRPQDADLLADAMPQARRLDLPDATHTLKADVPGQPFSTYTDRDLPLHTGLVPGIVAFLNDHLPAD